MSIKVYLETSRYDIHSVIIVVDFPPGPMTSHDYSMRARAMSYGVGLKVVDYPPPLSPQSCQANH
jgi:hypothetical protein